jgi:hypothetical protein
MKSTPFRKYGRQVASTSRGKYTLLIIAAFAIKLFAESVRVLAKKVQGTKGYKAE